MAWPLECLREAERHPYELAVRLRSRTAPNSLVPSHVRSVSAPRFERGLVGDLYTPSRASRLRDLSRILIESVPRVTVIQPSQMLLEQASELSIIQVLSSQEFFIFSTGVRLSSA